MVCDKCAFVMKGKLKLLRDNLRRWNVETFGKINLEVKEPIKEFNMLDLQVTKSMNLDLVSLTDKRFEALNKFQRQFESQRKYVVAKIQIQVDS